VQVAQLEAMGATLYQPGQQVKTNFGVVGFLDGMSSDGVKFVSVRGALLCTPTADTEVHDALLAAAQEVCASLPKRKRDEILDGLLMQQQHSILCWRGGMQQWLHPCSIQHRSLCVH